MKISLFLLPVLLLMALITGRESCYHDDATTEEMQLTQEEQREIEELRLDLIREKILIGLGMTQPPKIDKMEAGNLKNRLQKLPIFMRKSKSVESRPEKKNPTKVVVFAEIGDANPCLSPSWSHDNYTFMSFKMPESPSQVKDALLWYKPTDRKPSEEARSFQATMCTCVRSIRKKSNMVNYVLATSPSVIECVAMPQEDGNATTGQGWSNIRLENKWKTMLNNGEQRLLFVFNTKVTMTDKKRPFLSVDVNNKEKTRTKRYKREMERRQKDCPMVDATNSTTAKRQSCCRTKLWVDIKKLGWSDWIYSPSGFYFHYCSGHCDKGFDSLGDIRGDGTGLDYSSVLNAYIRRLNLNIKPCCVPKKMQHLPIVITTNGHTANRTFIPNFIVGECACIGFA